MPQQSYHIATVQGIGDRQRQEDSFACVNAHDVKAIRDKGLFFVVCDGMGGMKDGKVASETAIQKITQSFENLDYQNPISAQLKNSMFDASDEVEKLLEGEGGTTAIACLIYQDGLYFASVGDSFLYLKRGNKLIQLNHEHNLCNQMYLKKIREKDMDPQQARMHPESGSLTQFLGMTGLSDVDGFVRPYKLREGDLIFACSDGVGGTLSEEEIKSVLSYTQPETMCDAVNQAVLAHHKPNQDNYTGIVVKCVL